MTDTLTVSVSITDIVRRWSDRGAGPLANMVTMAVGCLAEDMPQSLEDQGENGEAGPLSVTVTMTMTVTVTVTVAPTVFVTMTMSDRGYQGQPEEE